MCSLFSKCLKMPSVTTLLQDLAVFLGTRVRRPFQCDEEATAVIQDYRRGLQGQARGRATAQE